MNKRIFVEKKNSFNIENEALKKDFNLMLKLNIKNVKLIKVYDIFNIDEELLEKSKYLVFGEKVTDTVLEEINLSEKYIAVEALKGSFDQRADSAMQCLKLIDPSSKAKVYSSIILLIEGVNDKQLNKIKEYYINKVESCEKDLTILKEDSENIIEEVISYENFINLNEDEIINFKQDLSLAMSNEDILHIQQYFKNEEKRNPTETELLMLDTYWSDHCRHTTFETLITNVEFKESNFKEVMQNTFNEYLEQRKVVHNDKKAMTLMDMATICGKYQRKKGNLDDMEISEEVNACSVYIDVEVNGVDEEWLLMFKNETHNHPTEIEPFGGASTCVGGAIRDPLSGRSYVYQAMRISGAKNPLEDIKDTIDGKLPQRVISKNSANGYSSYGNQIGLATTFVDEIYHDGYAAKHMEVGVVVAATPKKNVLRETAIPGDIVIMLGGRTGRDGVGGATGSSKVHTEESLQVSSAEVQKGNAPEERKIQRLFRRYEVASLIKKSNDFGAGGVSVAIGEIADSLHIYLDNVKTKYNGLNGTEVAISESQERMAVVVSKENVEKFINYCKEENIEAVIVADVTNSNRLIMEYKGQTIVNLSREFINTNGVMQSQNIKTPNIEDVNVFKREINGKNLKEKIFNNLSDLNIASQKGMIENFDATVGASTVLMPYGGMYQSTKAQASVQKIPVLNNDTSTVSVLSYGYNPKISKWSPYHGGAHAVIESMARVVAVGADYKKIRFTFQEYFEKLNKDCEKWGKPFSALLGSMYTLNGFDLAAIGGKDSMSGTFKDINVPPTLISFAVTTSKVDNIISQEFKEKNNYIYLIKHTINENKLPNIEQLKENFDFIINNNNIIKSSSAVLYGGLSQTLFEMSFGNKIGFNIETKEDLFETNYGSFIIETNKELNYKNAILLGKTDKNIFINNEEINLDEAFNKYNETFNELNNIEVDKDKDVVEEIKALKEIKTKKVSSKDVRVILPVFPGTNSEYDMEKAFHKEGAITKQIVFKNLTKEDIEQSINNLAKEINSSNILALSGGFSAGDEPDGSGKFIANILLNKTIKEAITLFLEKGGLILGICNGFQALIKSGLLPNGKFIEIKEDNPTLFKNNINRHISHITKTKVTSNNSPWLKSFENGEMHSVAVSHGEGKFVIDENLAKKLFENNQVAFQYCNFDKVPTMNGMHNPNGSTYAIEGIVSPCGQILGKMGHSERYSKDIYKNISGNKDQNIFKNAINHFKGE